MIKIYNTLTGHLDEFKPIKENEVSMYVCGPTVYNYIHIGNARPAIFFDTVRRYLEYRGYKVTYVQNFTDVDDKMINKANAENVSIKEIEERYPNLTPLDRDNIIEFVEKIQNDKFSANDLREMQETYAKIEWKNDKNIIHKLFRKY